MKFFVYVQICFQNVSPSSPSIKQEKIKPEDNNSRIAKDFQAIQGSPSSEPKFVIKDTGPDKKTDGLLNLYDIAGAPAGSSQEISEYIAQKVASGTKIVEFGENHYASPRMVRIRSIAKLVAQGKTVCLAFEMPPKRFEKSVALLNALSGADFSKNADSITKFKNQLYKEYIAYETACGTQLSPDVLSDLKEYSDNMAYELAAYRTVGAKIAFIDDENANAYTNQYNNKTITKEEYFEKEDQRNLTMANNTAECLKNSDVVYVCDGSVHAAIYSTRKGIMAHVNKPMGQILEEKYKDQHLSLNFVPSWKDIRTHKIPVAELTFDCWEQHICFKMDE